jgi:hypothetical protein
MSLRASPRRRFAVTAALTLAVIGATALAHARPGGGSSFSGSSRSSGGGSSGSGGGSGGAELIFFLFRLCFEYPLVGIPLLIAVVVFLVVKARSASGQEDWSAGNAPSQGSFTPPVAPPRARAGVQSALQRLRLTDANFSRVLLEDFLYALYAEVHTARGQGQAARLSAYLGAEPLAALSRAPATGVRDIVVGAMRFIALETRGAPPETALTVEFEANYTEGPSSAAQSYYVVERWTLARRVGVQSRTPDRARVFGCPGCGAPQDAVFAGTCRYCQRLVATGEFDWLIRNLAVVHRETRGPMLTGDTAEQGTNLPTVVDPAALATLGQLGAKDPAFDWTAFQARVDLIFKEFQAAWSARDLARMRPFLSDGLFQTQTYWVEAYKAAHLRNVSENARITRIELARVVSDRFFDAITVRVAASGLDYTLADEGGRLVSGSRSRDRVYTEYWTLIRGAARSGPTRTDAACPSCGAALKINMAGTCEYCRAKITSGEFDWVLSRIEQDEVYEG